MSRQDKATTEKFTKTLRDLVKRQDNKVCADCKRNGKSLLYILEISHSEIRRSTMGLMESVSVPLAYLDSVSYSRPVVSSYASVVQVSIVEWALISARSSL